MWTQTDPLLPAVIEKASRNREKAAMTQGETVLIRTMEGGAVRGELVEAGEDEIFVSVRGQRRVSYRYEAVASLGRLGRLPWHRWWVWLLAWLMMAGSPEEIEKMRRKALEIPLGAVVEVRVTHDEKWTGRIGAVSSEGFEFERATRVGIEQRMIRFEEVKGLKQKYKPLGAGRVVALSLETLFGLSLASMGIAAATR